MGISVLGPLEVDGGTTTLAPRERVVLAALALRAGEVLTSDQLADAVWGDEPPATWPKALQGAIVRIRKALGPGLVDTVDHGYRLLLPAGDVDAREFERLVARARDLLEGGEADRAAYAVEQALRLWRGDPLADLAGWSDGRQEADRLTELRRDAEELQVDAAMRSGHDGTALPAARRLVEEAPLRERRWELLALAQYRAGQQADALRTLHQLRRTLVSELGIDPGPDAVALERAILHQDPGLQPASTARVPATTCPYLGLVPYDVDDADSYFGREADVQACRRRLAEVGVLAVVGPSGSGKSSLVRAGLAASLRADGERVVVITPGKRPLDALPTGRRPSVLVVDQAEEAVTQPDHPEQAEHFFASLTAHASHGRLVVALRADRFGDLATYAGFARLVERGLYVLTPMAPANLRAAVEGPARLAGLRLEAGLVDVLVSEVEGQPGALPHLSHALRQTWERREGGVLTLEGYRATGGIRDAVARTAERVHDELPVDQRTLLRDVMLRLVSPGPEGDPVRSRVPRRLLTLDDAHDLVLERLVEARLVTSDEGVLELAHEALVRSWPRLRGWLDDDTEGQRLLRHLTVAADTWRAMGRPDDELYRGTRLAAALEWQDRARPELTPVESDFLDAGRRRARLKEQTALEHAHRQARTNRRLRLLLLGAVMLLVASLVTGSLAVRQANLAAEATRSADARLLASQAQLAEDVDRSLMLAVASFAAEPSNQARVGLLAALARLPQLAAVHPVPASWLTASPDGGTVVTMDLAHQVRFHDASSHELLGEYDPYPGLAVEAVSGNLTPLGFSGDGSRVALGILTVDDEVVRLLDTTTYDAVPTQPGGQPRWAHPSDVELSPDGRYLAVSLGILQGPRAGRHLIYVWDLTDREQPLQRIGLPSDTFHLEFSPDGRAIHASPGSNSDSRPGLWTWSTRTGELLHRAPHGGEALDASTDRALLGYATGSTTVLVEEDTGAVVRQLRGPVGTVTGIAFSVDGRLLAAVADDPAAFVWDVSSGRLLEQIPLANPVSGIAFGGDGRQLLVPRGSTLGVFDLTGTDRYITRLHREVPDTIGAWVFTRYASPYDPVVAVSRWVARRAMSVATVRTRGDEAPVSTLRAGWVTNTFEPAWSSDGEHLAYVDGDGELQVWRWRSGDMVASRDLAADHVAFTDDATGLFVSGPDGLQLLDPTTLDPLTEPVVIGGRVTDAALRPDRTAVLITAERDRGALGYTVTDRWQVVDLDSGDTLAEGGLRRPGTSLALAPGGDRLVVAGQAGLELVDLATGRSTPSQDRAGTAETEGLFPTFSPDGRLVATSDGFGRVSLWDGVTAELLGTVQPGDTQAQPLFQDDETLYLQYADAAAYVWDTSEQHAVDTACRILGRGPTREEWEAWFGERDYVDVCAGAG